MTWFADGVTQPTLSHPGLEAKCMIVTARAWWYSSQENHKQPAAIVSFVQHMPRMRKAIISGSSMHQR
jgi:hypothetical protein